MKNKWYCESETQISCPSPSHSSFLFCNSGDPAYLPAGWPYTVGLLSIQVGSQTFGARIYPYGKTKNRCPTGCRRAEKQWRGGIHFQHSQNVHSPLLNKALSSSTLTSRGIPAQDYFSTNCNVTGTKIIWWVLQMLKFVNKQETRWVMRATFVHDLGTWYRYSQLLRSSCLLSSLK